MNKIIPGAVGIVVGLTSILIFVKRSSGGQTDEQIRNGLREKLLEVLSSEETELLLMSYQPTRLSFVIANKRIDSTENMQVLRELLLEARMGQLIYGVLSKYGFTHEKIVILVTNYGLQKMFDLVRGGPNAELLIALHEVFSLPELDTKE